MIFQQELTSEHPPHCQCLGVRLRTRASQEHSLSSPRLQARATACAKAAEDSAWTNADSRDSVDIHFKLLMDLNKIVSRSRVQLNAILLSCFLRSWKFM